MTQPTPKHSSALERIQSRRATEAAIAKLKADITQASEEAQSCRIQAEAAWREARLYEAEINRKRQPNQLELARLYKLRQKAETLDRQADEAQRAFDELCAQLECLEKTEKPKHEGGIAIDEALAFQEALTALQTQIDTIEKHILEQEHIIEQANRQPPSLDSLYQRREDILADLAIGQGNQADLEALEAEIEQAEKAREKALKQIAKDQAKADKARQTLAGLRRKRDALTQELEALESHRQEVLQRVILGQAETLSETYIDQAQAIRETFTRLVALSLLSKDLGGPELAPINHLQIPALNTKPCREAALIQAPTWLVNLNGQNSQKDFMAAKEQEKARLREAGIELD